MFKVKEADELLFNISRDHYMKNFNKNPIETLELIKEHNQMIDNEQVSSILDKVYSFYEGILNMNIPGVRGLEGICSAS